MDNIKNLCLLCGETLTNDGKCPNGHSLKRMCINCKFCNENMCCTNEDNKNVMLKKINESAKEIVGDSYLITSIQITPVTLKYPNKKCRNWELNTAIIDNIASFFV